MNMECRLCGNNTDYLFSANILKKYEIKYFRCKKCLLVQTENPFWLEEAYKNPINLTDTGLLERNFQFAKKTKAIIYFFFDKNSKSLDYAGGYGIFTRLMRDIGFDFYWSDPFTENIFSRGFEYKKEMDNIELITSFESFEHFINPLEEIIKMTKISKNILFSTNVIPTPIPQPNQWWYYGLEHGQHISFYSYETFNFIAKQLGLNFYSCSKYLHLFTEKRINKNYYNFIFKYDKYFDKYINKKLKSKTFTDSQIILKNIGSN